MARPLAVLSVAFPFARVGPDAVGGAEQIASALDRALVLAGHRSIMIASEGSDVAGELVVAGCGDAETIDEGVRAAIHADVRRAMDVTLSRVAVDVVHMHGIDFHAYLPPAGVPTLITLHLPPAWYPAAALRPGRPGTWLHGVSGSQDAVLRRIIDGVGLLPPIPNGVPVARLAAAPHARRGFALLLGRICPEKGQHLGIDAARQAGVPLLIAGDVFPYAAHRDYFASEIAPRLDAHRRWIGPVGFARKRRLLSAARCLLVPSLAAETSSLVAMEAAACGTPVIAFRAGALAEIVEPERTGFLVSDVDEMACAIGSSGTIDRDICRSVAQARFSAERMTGSYIQRYRMLADAMVPV